MKILILIYSMYGHIYEMAKAAQKGALKVKDTEAVIKRVPETLSNEVLEKMNALDFQNKVLKNVPIATVDELADYDAIIFGVPTRYGNMPAQMKTFLDATGQLWMKGELIGKVGSVFSSSATQHGGQESTILTTHVVLLHHGMIIVGLPYSFQGQMRIDEITGGSPYGASTISGGQGERMPSQNELDAVMFQAENVANITKKLNSK